jgi:hypothetical protein
MAGGIGYQFGGFRDYSDLITLKEKVRTKNQVNEIMSNYLMATGGAGATIVVEEATGTAITNIGKTELTMVGAGSANDNGFDGLTCTMVYKDSDGVSHTAVVTVDTADSTDEEVFAPVVTDFYEMVSLTMSGAVPAGKTYGVGTTGVLTYGTISATETVATPVQLFGVGSIYGRYSADDASHNAETDVAILDYTTPWGTRVEGATMSTAADSTTEIRFIKADGVSYVNDFYRVSDLDLRITPHATATYLLTDAATSNVDGSGSDIWGMVEEGNLTNMTSRYFAPVLSATGRTMVSFLAKIKASYQTGIVVNQTCSVVVSFTPLGEAATTMTLILHSNGGPVPWEDPIPLEPATDLSVAVVDDGNDGGNASVSTIIIEGTDRMILS